jgi:hypothetical protein
MMESIPHHVWIVPGRPEIGEQRVAFVAQDPIRTERSSRDLAAALRAAPQTA